MPASGRPWSLLAATAFLAASPARALRRPGPPRGLAAALLVATLLAGCLSGADDDQATGGDEVLVDLSEFVNPMIEGHDHSDPSLHGYHWNMERTGGATLSSGTRSTAQPHALDVKAGKLFASAYAATGDEVAGVYIFDVETDPGAPRLLGSVEVRGPAAGDRNMEATADGQFVVLALQSLDCAGNVNPHGAGMYLIDASDPTNPMVVHHQLAAFTPSGTPNATTSLGQHSIIVHSAPDGNDYVYSGAGDGYIYRIDRDAQRFVKVGTFGAGHDASIFWDPIANRTLLLSADVSRFHIYDLADPAKPNLLGGWRLPEAPASNDPLYGVPVVGGLYKAQKEPSSYYIHTAVADHVGGRNIAVVNSEDFRHDPTIFWVLDITEPAEIGNLSHWVAPPGPYSPAGVESGDLLFSLHNPRFLNGVVSFSFYHAGVWQFDLNDPARWSDPQPRAYYLPTEGYVENPQPDGEPVIAYYCGLRLGGTDDSLEIPHDSAPYVFDLEVSGDHVYAADLNSGVHALRFEPGNSKIPE